MVWCGGVMALLGLIESFTKVNISSIITVPGLVNHQDEILGFEKRGDGFFRVASTASHYIEFSAVMAMVLPFGLHTARFGRTSGIRASAAVCTVLMAAAIPATLSRTGIVAAAVGGLVMFLVWPWRLRFNMAVLGVGMGAVMMAIRPGLAGTLISLFKSFGEDPSIQGRTNDYVYITQYFEQRPMLGRGPGTFVPTLYFFLDNEWLMHLVTAGIIGVVALAALHLTALSLNVISFRRAKHEVDRHLCACLIAGQLIGITVAGTFDAFSFSTYAVTFFLVTGFAGAMWRLTHPDREVRGAAQILND
jgi:O-antigen ligase